MHEINKMIDIAKIKIKAGNGGAGKVSFRREKFIPKGGPDGGDGGKGGDVYFVADNNMATLIDFRAKPIFAGQNGEEGGKKNMSGSNGEDLKIKVPVGTLIYEIKNDKEWGGLREILVADMDKPDKVFMTAKGGFGGKGNTRFKSSTNQTPLQYTKGGTGQEFTVRLEIKLVADVGLVGFPNAGKSTLLNQLTKANAKVSSYPFTTLSPNLGTLKLKNGRDIVIADIPGLIEGASIGKGLGDEFLRHIERTRIIVHLIDPLEALDGQDIVLNSLKLYNIIRGELSEYGNDLDKKEELVVINKIDITEINEAFAKIKKEFSKKSIEVFGISGVTGEGIETLMDRISDVLQKYTEHFSFNVEKPVSVFTIQNLPNKRLVFSERNVEEKEKQV